MNIKKIVTLLLITSLFLYGSYAFAEGLADRRNERPTKVISTDLLIEHINKGLAPTAAGDSLSVDVNGIARILNFKYLGGRHLPQYKNMTAFEYKRSVEGMK
jgi:hypothetical protein